MPIIKIPQSAIDRSKPPSDGWHLMKIENFAETDSKDKGSKNWVFDLVIIEDGENNGRYTFGRFNSKAVGFLITGGFLPAAYDKPINSEFEFNPDEIIGKELYGLVKTEMYEGKPVKKCEEFVTASRPPF